MKTVGIRYKVDGGLEVVDLHVPDPGPGEVQLQGAYGGICSWDQYTFRHGTGGEFPAPPGHEGVGYVTKIGPGVTGLREGDRVVGRSFAHAYNMDARRAYVIPDSKIPDEQWIVEPVSCVVTGLDRCELRAGDRVVVIGCGFMGLMLVQGLGHSFAEQIIGIDINPQRLELAKRFGATETFDARDEGFAERVKELYSREIDTVVDCTGVQQGLDMATEIVKIGGRILLFGWNRGPTTFDGSAWHMGGYTVINSSPDSAVRDVFPPAIRLLLHGIIDLEPLITHVVDLEDYGDLMERIAGGQEPDYIKGVVRL